MKQLTILLMLLALAGCGEKFSGEIGEIDTTILEECDLPIEPVVVFTTTWCGSCKQLKSRMKSKKITYHEIDAEENSYQFDCVGGKHFPWLLVEGKSVDISSGRELTKALKPYANR